MNLFEQIMYEILNESGKTPAQRLKEATPQQERELEKVKAALQSEFDKIIDSLSLENGPLPNGLLLKPSPRSGKMEDFRVKSHIFSVDEEWIKNALVSNGVKGFEINTLEGKEAKQFSGKYTTIKVTTFSDAEVYITLTGGGKTGEKQLTPKSFAIEGKIIKYKELYNQVNNKIDSVVQDDDIKGYLRYLLEAVTFAPLKKSGKTIKVIVDDYEGEVSSTDQARISKDFGEIIGAILVARDDNNEDIYFPTAANEPLVDYEVGSYRYSAKSLVGASPTLTSIAKKYDTFVKDEMEGTPLEKKKISKIFEYLNSSSLNASQTNLAMTKATNEESWQAFLDFMEMTNVDPTEKKVLDDINNKMEEYYNLDILGEKLDTYYLSLEKASHYKTTGSGRRSVEDYNESDSNNYGYVTSPMGYALAQYLNNYDKDVKSSLRKIIRQLEDVKQINFNYKKGLEFTITSFLDDDFDIEFKGGGSIKSPNQQKIRFKVKVK